MIPRKYDSTVARIAGNIASGIIAKTDHIYDPKDIAEESVTLARWIVVATMEPEPAVEDDARTDTSTKR